MRCRGDSGDAVTAFGTYPLTMQRNASLFFAEIPDDIGQLAANPDLGQMLVHEESLAFGIANDDTRHVECIFSAFNIICVRFACILSTISVTYLNGCNTPSNAAAGLRPPRKGTDRGRRA